MLPKETQREERKAKVAKVKRVAQLLNPRSLQVGIEVSFLQKIPLALPMKADQYSPCRTCAVTRPAKSRTEHLETG